LWSEELNVDELSVDELNVEELSVDALLLIGFKVDEFIFLKFDSRLTNLFPFPFCLLAIGSSHFP